MTPEAQRIAIAEACGWRSIRHGYGYPTEEATGVRLLPLYLTDLNDMHEAEKVLTPKQAIKARWVLLQVLDRWETWGQNDYEMLDIWEMSLTDINDCLAATAAQRAEAFLRTIGKWKDGQ